MIRASGSRFVDEHGRTLLLRGVNLGGSSKMPRDGDSFIGRPFHLHEADAHFDRLRSWGLTTLRLLTTWEAVEHDGPGRYDLAYLDFFEALIRRAADFGLHVFVDFHQDVWSRFTGGDGAPGWTLDAVGFDRAHLHRTGAAFLETEHQGPLPKMVWPTNAGKHGSATMFTLFFGGDVFAPQRRVEGEGAQSYLQRHFFGAVEQVVRRVARLPNVFGLDLLNEPSPGYIEWADLTTPHAPVEVGAMPSPSQSVALGLGASLDVDVFHRGLTGVRVVGRERVNASGLRAWREGFSDPWVEQGVFSADGAVLQPQWFSHRDGRALSFADDFYRPFLLEGARRVHAIAPELCVMLETEPFREGPRWNEPGAFGWAPHWYDGFVLFLKDFSRFVAADAFTKKPVFLPSRIRRSFEQQLRRLASDGHARGMPALIGELGIAFDLKHRADRVPAMDRTMTAIEDAGVNATLWNYTADNTPERGDGWNGEDLSIYCAAEGGGRALEAVVRPRPVAVAGVIERYGFSRKTKVFELVVRVDQACRAPTEVFVPTLQYPTPPRIEADGSVTLEGSRLVWTHSSAPATQRLTIHPERRGAAP